MSETSPPHVYRPFADLLALGAVSAVLLAFSLTTPVAGESLMPSPGAMDRQTVQARLHDFTYLDDPAHVRAYVNAGELVPLTGNRNYEVKEGISFPYARPEVKLFVERISKPYRKACGEKLVVTSLTRPRSHRPRNSSVRSVHATGMALDLRRSWTAQCRGWLENELLALERLRLLEATRERRPPHYHIALFPSAYSDYIVRLDSGMIEPPEDDLRSHEVRRGETLWAIAKRYRTTVEVVKAKNGLRSNRIRPGQVLQVPSR